MEEYTHMRSRWWSWKHHDACLRRILVLKSTKWNTYHYVLRLKSPCKRPFFMLIIFLWRKIYFFDYQSLCVYFHYQYELVSCWPYNNDWDDGDTSVCKLPTCRWRQLPDVWPVLKDPTRWALLDQSPLETGPLWVTLSDLSPSECSEIWLHPTVYHLKSIALISALFLRDVRWAAQRLMSHSPETRRPVEWMEPWSKLLTRLAVQLNWLVSLVDAHRLWPSRASLTCMRWKQPCAWDGDAREDTHLFQESRWLWMY